MSARISNSITFRQTGPNTAHVTLKPPVGNGPQQGTAAPSKKGGGPNTEAIDLVRALIERRFGITTVDAPAQPRHPNPASTAPSVRIKGQDGNAVFKFPLTQREAEYCLITTFLFLHFILAGPGSPDDIFVEGRTKNASPPRESRRSWSHELPSLAGHEASGLPLVPRSAASRPVIAAAPERKPLETIETIEIEAPEQAAATETPAAIEPLNTSAEPQQTLPEMPAPDSDVYAAYRTAPPAAEPQQTRPEMPNPDSDVYAAYRQGAAVETASRETAPTADSRDPQVFGRTYSQALALRAAVDSSDYHAQASAREARRSADEAEQLSAEAARQQDHAKAQALRDDAQRFHDRAEHLKAEAERHRVAAEAYGAEIAAIERQRDDGLTPVPAV